MTVKGPNRAATRNEYEYPIPATGAVDLLKVCDTPILEKNRYTVVCDGLKWEVDEFPG